VSDQLRRSTAASADGARPQVITRINDTWVDVDWSQMETTGSASLGPVPPRLDMDELVDRVVDRIEQRVVDELERRGRRHTPGAF